MTAPTHTHMMYPESPMHRRYLVAFLFGLLTTQLHSQELELVGTIPGPATTVTVHENRAYVSEGPTLRLFNIEEPTRPSLLGSFTFPQNIYGVSVSGTIVYAAGDFYGLGIIDVSNPAAPEQIGYFQTPGQALSVAHAGSTVVVTNRLSGLELIDVSNPSAPVSQGSYFTEGYAIDVDAAGAFAYVIDTPGGLSVIDLSQSGDLEPTGIQGVREPSAAISVTNFRSPDGRDITLAGLMSANSGLELFDVSSPSTPMSVGTYRDPGRPQTTFIGAAATVGYVRVQMHGSRAFLADVYPPFELQMIDVSDPTAPSLVTSFVPPSTPRDIAVSGQLVLLAIGPTPGAATSTPSPGVLILRLKS